MIGARAARRPWNGSTGLRAGGRPRAGARRACTHTDGLVLTHPHRHGRACPGHPRLLFGVGVRRGCTGTRVYPSSGIIESQRKSAIADLLCTRPGMTGEGPVPLVSCCLTGHRPSGGCASPVAEPHAAAADVSRLFQGRRAADGYDDTIRHLAACDEHQQARQAGISTPLLAAASAYHGLAAP